MANTQTRTTRRKPAQTRKASTRKQAAVKRQASRKPSQTRKAPAKKPATAKKRVSKARVNRGGGAALPDFGNDWKVTVIRGKASEISRGDCFRTGQTVAQNLAAQKDAGFRGRRKYLRNQRAIGRVKLTAPKGR